MANIFVCSFYKSGSNHVSDSLANLLGAHRTFLSSPGEGYAQDPQRINTNAIATMLNRLDGMVYLQHVMGTKANQDLLKTFNAFTIVTMRKLLPCLHSLRRYEDLLVDCGKKGRQYVNFMWDTFDNDEKWLWIAYNIIPWYYQCYVSWMTAEIPRHIVWYEEHFADQIASAHKMLQHLDSDVFTDEQIAAAFLHRNSNYTKDRTEYPIPDYVKEIAKNQAKAWGSWEEDIVKDLL